MRAMCSAEVLGFSWRIRLRSRGTLVAQLLLAPAVSVWLVCCSFLFPDTTLLRFRQIGFEFRMCTVAGE